MQVEERKRKIENLKGSIMKKMIALVILCVVVGYGQKKEVEQTVKLDSMITSVNEKIARLEKDYVTIGEQIETAKQQQQQIIGAVIILREQKTQLEALKPKKVEAKEKK